jgi:hypothetical protein
VLLRGTFDFLILLPRYSAKAELIRAYSQQLATTILGLSLEFWSNQCLAPIGGDEVVVGRKTLLIAFVNARAGPGLGRERMALRIVWTIGRAIISIALP